MEPLPISAYIRTKNEERRIGEVVAAALQLCAEVIVVDSESTDRTREVAEKLGAKVILQPWLGNGHQKRVAEDAAQYDWLLDLDADEVVSDALNQSVRELFKEEPKEGVYAIKVATVDPTGQLWEYGAADYRDKLYNKMQYRCPASKVWSNLEVPKGTVVKKLAGYLEHYSFPNIEFLLTKLNRVSTMRAQEKKLKPLPLVIFRILFFFPIYLCRNLFRRGMWRYGVYAWSIAATTAASRWLTDVKMYEIHKGVK